MLAIERRGEILRLIRRDGSVKVNDLSTLFNVTEETIRRDLDKLDKEGQLKKTYGGAVLLDSLSEDVSYIDREKTNIKEKKIIAETAQQYIKSGDTIFIDASTTAIEVAKAIDSSKEVTIITNSVLAVSQLNQYEHLKIIGIGGTLNSKTLSMEGPVTTKFIDYYYADKLFFSVKGFTKQRGLMDSKENSVDIKQHMIKNTKQVILVIDSMKFGQSAMYSAIDIDNVDILISDYKIDKEWEDYFELHEVVVVNPSK